MDFHGTCVKCQSNNLAMARRGHTHQFLSFLRYVSMKTLVCCDCGHIEEFVPQDQLEKLRTHAYRG